jgi:hypothetical protein
LIAMSQKVKAATTARKYVTVSIRVPEGGYELFRNVGQLLGYDSVEDYAAWLMNNEVDSWDEMLKQVISEAEHKGGIRFEPVGAGSR